MVSSAPGARPRSPSSPCSCRGSCWSCSPQVERTTCRPLRRFAKEINVSTFGDHGVVIATQHGRFLRVCEIPLAEVSFFISLEPIAIGWDQQRHAELVELIATARLLTIEHRRARYSRIFLSHRRKSSPCPACIGAKLTAWYPRPRPGIPWPSANDDVQPSTVSTKAPSSSRRGRPRRS